MNACEGSRSAAAAATECCNDESSGSNLPAVLPTRGDGPTRISLPDDALDSLTADELRSHWRRQQAYIDSLESLNADRQGEVRALRESEEKLKQQLNDLSLRERLLVRRLAAKEQDMHEYAGQLSEMKGGQAPSVGALRNALVDPAVNVLIQKLRHELAATRTRLDDTQNELAAWKFTPDSNTGKRLMAKCRLLYQENEELGRMVSSGRLAKLEGDLALQKSFSEEVKKSQSELDELLQDLDEDVEGMQSTIYYLQQELRKAKEVAANLERENSALRGGSNEQQQQQQQQQPLNGISVVVQHNGKWCPPPSQQSKEDPVADELSEPDRGNHEDCNLKEEEEEEEENKNERLVGGAVTIENNNGSVDQLTRLPGATTTTTQQDDSAIVVKNTAQRTPNCAAIEDSNGQPPPCKKPRTDHDNNISSSTPNSSTMNHPAASNSSIRYNNQQQTVITNGDVSAQ